MADATEPAFLPNLATHRRCFPVENSAKKGQEKGAPGFKRPCAFVLPLACIPSSCDQGKRAKALPRCKTPMLLVIISLLPWDFPVKWPKPRIILVKIIHEQ